MNQEPISNHLDTNNDEQDHVDPNNNNMIMIVSNDFRDLDIYCVSLILQYCDLTQTLPHLLFLNRQWSSTVSKYMSKLNHLTLRQIDKLVMYHHHQLISCYNEEQDYLYCDLRVSTDDEDEDDDGEDGENDEEPDEDDHANKNTSAMMSMVDDDDDQNDQDIRDDRDESKNHRAMVAIRSGNRRGHGDANNNGDHAVKPVISYHKKKNPSSSDKDHGEEEEEDEWEGELDYHFHDSEDEIENASTATNSKKNMQDSDDDDDEDSENSDDEEELTYDVDRILDKRTTVLKNGKKMEEYLVKWLDYDHEDNTWETGENVKDSDLKMKQFQKKRLREKKKWEDSSSKRRKKMTESGQLKQASSTRTVAVVDGASSGSNSGSASSSSKDKGGKDQNRDTNNRQRQEEVEETYVEFLARFGEKIMNSVREYDKQLYDTLVSSDTFDIKHIQGHSLNMLLYRHIHRIVKYEKKYENEIREFDGRITHDVFHFDRLNKKNIQFQKVFENKPRCSHFFEKELRDLLAFRYKELQIRCDLLAEDKDAPKSNSSSNLEEEVERLKQFAQTQ